MSFESKIFRCHQGYLKNTDGSALLTEGTTSVLAGVYGPGDIRESRQNAQKGVVEVNFRPKIGIPTLNEKYLEQFVRKVLESAIILEDHPRSCFYVITQIMESRGSLLACSINAAVLALQDAGVSMNFIPVAVCVAVCEKEDINGVKNNQMVVGPNKEDEETQIAHMTFTFNSVTNNLACCHQQGSLSQEMYDKCLQLAQQESSDKLKAFREVLSANYIGCR